LKAILSPTNRPAWRPAGQFRQSPANPLSRKQETLPKIARPRQAKQYTKGCPTEPKEDLGRPGKAHRDPELTPENAMRTSEFLPCWGSVQNMCTHSVNICIYTVIQHGYHQALMLLRITPKLNTVVEALIFKNKGSASTGAMTNENLTTKPEASSKTRYARKPTAKIH
jgi:hypothetical protein